MKTMDEQFVLRAVWAHCLDCSGGSRKSVQRCEVHECSLYPWRNVSAALKSAEEAIEKRRSAQTAADIMKVAVGGGKF